MMKGIISLMQSMNIKFKPIENEDLEFINSIRNDEATRKHLRNTDVISLEDTRSWFQRENPKWFIVIIDDDKVGYVRTSQETEDSICIGCDIKKEKRGLGLAKFVYRHLLEELYKKYKLLWLEVFEDNTVALNLYKKMNFHEVNRYKFKNRTAIIMVHQNVK